MSYYISDKINREHCELTSAIKVTKHSLNKHLIFKAFKNFNEKIKIQNALLFYEIASKFNLLDTNTTVLKYIKRCFSVIVETESFLELDFNSVSKLLASSSLQIDSEVEVYNAANKWLNHNIKERSKFAKQLLLKVRLNLLSDHCLTYLKNCSSFISKNNDCFKMLKSRNIIYQNNIADHNNSRYCNQTMSNILICGGYDMGENKYLKQVKEVNGKNFKEHMRLPAMLEKRSNFKVVYLKGEVFVLGGNSSPQPRLKAVEKYSPINKIWNKVTSLPDERQSFCACAFMDKIYIFGGFNVGEFNSCLQLDTNNLKWKEVARMNEAKSDAACAIFEGRIVVCGGYHFRDSLKTVESYDVFADSWKPMPSMVTSRSSHSLICVKSKLFAIGGTNDLNTNCEVFDETSNMFVELKTPKLCSYSVTAVSIGSKIFVLHNYTQVVFCYDVVKDEWSEECCEATENNNMYSSVTVPLF